MSENLGATAVKLVAPVGTSLMYKVIRWTASSKWSGQKLIQQMYIFFKVVTVKSPIVSQDKKIQDTGDSLATKKKVGKHLLPPFYQGHLYK